MLCDGCIERCCSGLARAQATKRLEAPALRKVIGDEELLDFIEPAGSKIGKRAIFRFVHWRLRHRYQPIVAQRPSFFSVWRATITPDQPHRYDAARKCRRFHQHENIERVAVVGPRAGDKAEIIGERMAGGQGFCSV